MNIFEAAFGGIHVERFGGDYQNITGNVAHKTIFLKGQSSVALRTIDNFQIRVPVRGNQIGFRLFSDICQSRHKKLPPYCYFILQIFSCYFYIIGFLLLFYIAGF
jgi:hypothetical protein